VSKQHWVQLAASLIIVAGLALAGCGGQQTPPAPAVAPQAEVTQAPAPEPTAEAGLAAIVNGVPIAVEVYERELARRRAGWAALGWELPTDGADEQQVLNVVIEYELIRQEAEAQGLVVSDEEVNAEIAELIDLSGGVEAFEAWREANMFTEEEFHEVTRLELLTQQLLADVVADVPDVAEQVHARHILVDTQEEAEAVLEQLSAGADFAELAAEYSRDTSTRENGGDLDWFPRGGLLWVEVEDAAFSLEDGQISTVVVSPVGYHFVQTLEHDLAREVPPETLDRLRKRAIEDWKASLWEGADVQRFIGEP
jgi:parvulin-like peptidyl-prolyl isomerase